MLCPWKLAATLDVLVCGADELDLEPVQAKQLLKTDADSWSGLTLHEDGVHVIVLNSAHSRARQCATLMHEIAHILLDHLPARIDVSTSGLVLLSHYSKDQEDEADWLGAALLLPEVALMVRREAGIAIAEIAREFGVSEPLCTWRCRMTGIEKRLAFKRAA